MQNFRKFLDISKHFDEANLSMIALLLGTNIRIVCIDLNAYICHDSNCWQDVKSYSLQAVIIIMLITYCELSPNWRPTSDRGDRVTQVSAKF